MTKNGDKAGVGQGAVVAMSPDGAVRALVGGRNYAESQFNRAVAAKRQPGSAFKPFVYLTAIERGLTPDTVREDKPIAVKGWQPENYSREYFGPVTLTQALALSLNTVSVRLTLEFGPTAVMRTAHRLGIASKLEPNASLALGTSEVSVLELVGAYAAFANGGMRGVAACGRARAHGGRQAACTSARTTISAASSRRATSAMMNAMMQETLLTGTARKAELPGWPAAGKTGTSQDFRDAWFIGYTGHLVTGVWLGNDDASPTKKTTGGGLPVEIWSKFMKAAHQGVPVAALPGVSSAPLTAGLPPFGGSRLAPPAPVSRLRRPGPAGVGRRRHRQLADRPAVRPALDAAARREHRGSASTARSDRPPGEHHRDGERPCASAPSVWPRIAPTTADEVCVTKPSSDDAAPARSGTAAARRPAPAPASCPCRSDRGRSPRSRPSAPNGVKASSSDHHQPAERHRSGAEPHRPAAAPAHHEARRDRRADHVADEPTAKASPNASADRP